MLTRTVLAVTAVLLQQYALHVDGHARLREPPSRSSMWREKAFETHPANTNDNELNCGGSSNQWNAQGGQCGICGDPYQNPQPRENERGGKYGNGPQTRTYSEGDTIPIKVDVTANHKGYFEIRVCPTNNHNIIATQACLDQYIIPLSDGSGNRWNVPPGSQTFEYHVTLPAGLTCSWCVLQWKYHTGNSWGTDPDGTSCVGCGAQEQFYGCADVAIVPASGGGGNPIPAPNPPPAVPPATPPPAIPPPSWQPPPPPPSWQPPPPPPSWQPPPPPPPPPPPSSGGSCGRNLNSPWSTLPGLDRWCQTNCAAGYCPQSHCSSSCL